MNKKHQSLPKPIVIHLPMPDPDECSCSSEGMEWSEEKQWYICDECGLLVPEDQILED